MYQDDLVERVDLIGVGRAARLGRDEVRQRARREDQREQAGRRERGLAAGGSRGRVGAAVRRGLGVGLTSCRKARGIHKSRRWPAPQLDLPATARPARLGGRRVRGHPYTGRPCARRGPFERRLGSSSRPGSRCPSCAGGPSSRGRRCSPAPGSRQRRCASRYPARAPATWLWSR